MEKKYCSHCKCNHTLDKFPVKKIPKGTTELSKICQKGLEARKRYKEKNEEKIWEYQRNYKQEIIECECGTEYQERYKKKHMESVCHLKEKHPKHKNFKG